MAKVGVEGTGSYGAGLARFLRKSHVEVIEVDRPNREERESLVKPVAELGKPKRRQSTRGQFDCQRNAIKPATDI